MYRSLREILCSICLIFTVNSKTKFIDIVAMSTLLSETPNAAIFTKLQSVTGWCITLSILCCIHNLIKSLSMTHTRVEMEEEHTGHCADSRHLRGRFQKTTLASVGF